MEYIILHNRDRRREAAAGTEQPPGNQLALGLELPDGPATCPAAAEQAGGRYYALVWAPAITGDGWVVERTWGPLYNHRRQRKATFADDQAAALDLVARHLRRRFRHGYIIRDATSQGRALAEQTRRRA